MTPCKCTCEGFCETLGRNMTGRVYQLCKTDINYYRIFRKRAGLSLEPTEVPSSRVSCVHAGPDLGHVSTPMGLLPVLGCCHQNHEETTPAHCEYCPDRIEGEPEKPSIESFLPVVGKGPRIQEWAVGMVTAPRQEPTFERSVRSLIRAGFESPRIFAEPGSPIPDDLRHLPITQRDTIANAWGNYYLALHEMMTRHPKADAYLIAQDDVLFTPGTSRENLRQYLDRALWPSDDTGAVSIYCSTAYARPEAGWHERQGKWVWGACAFVWPRESLRHFLATTAADWTAQGRDRKVDIAIGVWQQQHAKRIYFCSPSVTQHIGDTSTIWKSNSKASGRRKAKQFVGDMLL